MRNKKGVGIGAHAHLGKKWIYSRDRKLARGPRNSVDWLPLPKKQRYPSYGYCRNSQCTKTASASKTLQKYNRLPGLSLPVGVTVDLMRSRGDLM